MNPLEKLNAWLDTKPKGMDERMIEYRAAAAAKKQTPTFEGYLKASGPVGWLTALSRHDEVRQIEVRRLDE